MDFRGVNNGKAGKAAALPKYLDTLTLSQPRGAYYAQPLALPHLKTFVITPLPLATLMKDFMELHPTFQYTHSN